MIWVVDDEDGWCGAERQRRAVAEAGERTASKAEEAAALAEV